ncbi:MAG TPA: PQQ-dependent dehydrogenase, methanol/ethanol family [Terriglobales bacterium]|jgi:PQQ-dependent dehydrogenase (methanol/ethanol family)|nr:PQQ-dependent dehydrogenase, methanol/ethanol family [Terriglobales bacterium]
MRLLSFSFLTLVLAAQSPAQSNKGSSNDVPGWQPGVHLISPLPTGEWVMPSGDYANTRFSPLAQINTENVKNLHITGMMSTGIPHGHEGGPLIVNKTMYVVTPFPNYLIALDLTKPDYPMKWKFEPNPDPRSVGIACCDTVNRGASYADGKIIYNTLDAKTVAVDANTGQQIWRTTVGDTNLGETITMAPLIVKNVVLVGDSGGELGVRGKLTALDLKSGKILWRAYSSGPDADAKIGANFKPFYPKDQGKDLGVTSWTQDQWRMGGGTIWGWISYDPELNLIYYGTGNPGVWNDDMRPGDNKWSVTIWARNPETGDAKWAYQIEPHDGWDYDEIMENVLVDMPWQGRTRKLLIHPGRTGFIFVMDRETGEVLSAENFVPVTWASGYDLKTGMPIGNEDKRPHTNHYAMGVCPSSTGGKEFVPSAFSPKTGYIYIPAHNTCMDYAGEDVNYIAGTPYLGASVRMYPGPGGYQGELIAWDVANAKKVWSIKDPDFPVYSGVLATSGDLVFYGTMDGHFRAVDSRNGNVLWQVKLASGIIGNPVTFLGADGKQYVAIYAGIGGWMGAVALPSVSTDDDYAALGVVGAMKKIKQVTAPGGVLYVFGY